MFLQEKVLSVSLFNILISKLKNFKSQMNYSQSNGNTYEGNPNPPPLAKKKFTRSKQSLKSEPPEGLRST